MLISMSLRCPFCPRCIYLDATSILLSLQVYFTSIECTSRSHRFTSTSFRFHLEAASTSSGLHFEVTLTHPALTLCPLRLDYEFASIALRYRFDVAFSAFAMEKGTHSPRKRKGKLCEAARKREPAPYTHTLAPARIDNR